MPRQSLATVARTRSHFYVVVLATVGAKLMSYRILPPRESARSHRDAYSSAGCSPRVRGRTDGHWLTIEVFSVYDMADRISGRLG